MTALRAVAAYVPPLRVRIEELAGQLALSPSQVQVLQRFRGLAEVRRQAPGETVTDLLAGAVSTLDELRGREHLVRYVLYARGVPVATPFPVNPLHELCQKAGLGHAVAFTVTHHGCATSLLAIDIAGRLLTADAEPDALALVVAGEQVFTQDDHLPPDVRIFGEGAGACLVSATGPRDRVLSYVFRQRGDLDHWLPGSTDHAERFAREYRPVLSEVILAAVDRAGLRLDEVAVVLPHNVNVAAWRKVCGLIGFPDDRVLLDNVPRFGHTFASDAFVNYRTAVDTGRLRAGDRYVIAAAGYGAIFAAMVLEH